MYKGVYIINYMDSKLPKELIMDYYDWCFKNLGIKNYELNCDSEKPCHNLFFLDKLNQSQFEFYFGDIIIESYNIL